MAPPAGGPVLQAVVGSAVRVHLEGNPTTGHKWVVTELKGNSVEQEGEIVYDPNAAPGRMGAGGKFVATFRARQPGKARARLEYRRPWEEDVPPAKVLTIDFDVKPAP